MAFLMPLLAGLLPSLLAPTLNRVGQNIDDAAASGRKRKRGGKRKGKKGGALLGSDGHGIRRLIAQAGARHHMPRRARGMGGMYGPAYGRRRGGTAIITPLASINPGAKP